VTLKAFQAQARHLSALPDAVCFRAATGAHAWVLLLDFGALGPPDERGSRQPDFGPVVECPWRLEDGLRVIVGSGDQDEVIAPRIQACVGRRVIGTEVLTPSYTARVRFEGDLTLWIFPDDSKDYAESSEHPSCPWYLAGLAVPGGWQE
jgi:hypothetical protein